MHRLMLTIAFFILAPMTVGAAEQKLFKWTDADGMVHYGDVIPAEYAELPKEILNDHGVIIDSIAGKKTDEQKEADRLENARRVAIEMQQQADQALLATYLTVEEILMHRDRRVELFQAQSRVTEFYLSNLGRRLEGLRKDAANYRPYNESSTAKAIPEDLADDLRSTEETIERHEQNLKKFLADEKLIIARFDGDVSRFKLLKGIE